MYLKVILRKLDHSFRTGFRYFTGYIVDFIDKSGNTTEEARGEVTVYNVDMDIYGHYFRKRKESEPHIPDLLNISPSNSSIDERIPFDCKLNLRLLKYKAKLFAIKLAIDRGATFLDDAISNKMMFITRDLGDK